MKTNKELVADLLIHARKMEEEYGFHTTAGLLNEAAERLQAQLVDKRVVLSMKAPGHYEGRGVFKTTGEEVDIKIEDATERWGALRYMLSIGSHAPVFYRTMRLCRKAIDEAFIAPEEGEER